MVKLLKKYILVLGLLSLLLIIGSVSTMENTLGQPQQGAPINGGEVLEDLSEVAAPPNVTNSTLSEGVSTTPEQSSNQSSSRLRVPSAPADQIPGMNQEFFDETTEDVNPIRCQTNPYNAKAPCTGTDNRDIMIGTDTDDFMYGLDGDDTIFGMANIGGQVGYDLLDGGDGADTLYGGDDTDLIAGGNGNDLIYGEEGNDNLWGREGNDFVDGGDGNDMLGGNFGSDTINGGQGDDKIYHGEYSTSPFFDKGPDGSKDIIDCGPGQDEAWINRITDGDMTENCEKVHTVRPDAGSFDDNLLDTRPQSR